MSFLELFVSTGKEKNWDVKNYYTKSSLTEKVIEPIHTTKCLTLSSKKRVSYEGVERKNRSFLLKTPTLYPDPHLNILKSIKGDENGNHSNSLNTH